MVTTAREKDKKVQFLESEEGCTYEGYSIRFYCSQVKCEAPAVFNMIV